MIDSIDILIPTYRRPEALAVTLTALYFQGFKDFRVLISDQTEDPGNIERQEIKAAIRLLTTSRQVDQYRHRPRRGMAEQRNFLLSMAEAPYVLFLDDDLVLDTWVLELMAETIREEMCGFVGCAPIGLSYVNDVRPAEQGITFWRGHVKPEIVRPNSAAWERYKLHNAANIYHVQRRYSATPGKARTYRIAWVGGCVLYDRIKLESTGGFSFWERLPPNHAGEEIVAQLRLMSRFGGCGIIPSGVYHQELPTTVPDRTYDAPNIVLTE